MHTQGHVMYVLNNWKVVLNEMCHGEFTPGYETVEFQLYTQSLTAIFINTSECKYRFPKTRKIILVVLKLHYYCLLPTLASSFKNSKYRKQSLNEEQWSHTYPSQWLSGAKRTSQIQLSFVFLCWLHLRGAHDCLLYHFPQLLNLQFTWSYLLKAKWNSNGLVPSQLGPFLASRQGTISHNTQAMSIGTIYMKQFTKPVSHFSR